LVKVAVWRVAKLEYERYNNVSLEALALDNFNDILSNSSALFFASLTRASKATWWMDPVGGVIISIYIIRSWCLTAFEQVNMLIGKMAGTEFLDSVREIAENHDPSAELDLVRAYHFGPKLMVEVKLVMHAETPLEMSHDVGVSLQDRIERLYECERCFVQIDYQHRDQDEHDTKVPVRDKINPDSLKRDSLTGLRLRTVLSLGNRKASFSSSNASSTFGEFRTVRSRQCSLDSANSPIVPSVKDSCTDDGRRRARSEIIPGNRRSSSTPELRSLVPAALEVESERTKLVGPPSDDASPFQPL
jgi:hypothetical protein